jgi:preprotein translocase subunit SecA
MLRIVDSRWIRHLTDLDELREGIGLRAFAQQDPLVAYKKEAHEMYQDLVSSISHDIAYAIFHAQLVTRPAMPVQRMQVNRTDGGGQAQPVRKGAKGELGRNDPCWCGSGKKYKQCHMRSDQGREPAAAAAEGNGQPAARQQTQNAPQQAVVAGRNTAPGKQQKGKSGKR